MQDYILIIILELIGIGFHTGQKVLELDKKSPDDSLSDVFGFFWKSDRITILISGLVLALNLVGHYIMEEYAPKHITEWEYYDLVSFVIALLLGYFGQRKIYQVFGKAEAFIDKRIEQKLG
jgi:hypothetical protein